MTINRFNSADNFVMMSKQGLKDERLSWKAKGILAYMMSLPADWQTHLSEVARHSTDGIDSLRGGFKELEEYGYVRRYQGNKEKGKFGKWVTDVSDVPIYKKSSVEEPNKIEPDVEKPDVEKPHVEIPYADNPTLLSNNSTKNKITNNKRQNFTSSDMQLAELLYHHITKHNPNHKRPNLEKWANTFRLMREKDERTHEAIERCINWCQNDSFWYKNILSADKLREKYDQLFIAAKSKKQKSLPIQQQVIQSPAQEAQISFD